MKIRKPVVQAEFAGSHNSSIAYSTLMYVGVSLQSSHVCC